MGNMMDDLRQQALVEQIESEDIDKYAARASSEKIFGMTAPERMFVSIGCFLMTSLVGFLLLLLTDKIALP